MILKTPIDRLDYTLKYFSNEIRKNKVDYKYLKDKLIDKGQLNDESELIKVLNKLESDKYINISGRVVTRTQGSYQETYIQEDTKMYSVTFEGEFFSQKGGYGKKTSNEKAYKFFKIIETVTLIIVSLGTLYYAAKSYNETKYRDDLELKDKFLNLPKQSQDSIVSKK